MGTQNLYRIINKKLTAFPSKMQVRKSWTVRVIYEQFIKLSLQFITFIHELFFLRTNQRFVSVPFQAVL